MIIRFDYKDVNVSKEICSELECFYLFADKGSFVPGRGYTCYHNRPIWCCGTRHLHGCPVIGICLDCRRVVTPSRNMNKCEYCGSIQIEDRRNKEIDAKDT